MIRLDGVPASRTARMVTEAMQVKAQRIRRHSPERRDATLALCARHLHATAHDDVIDVLPIVLHDLTAKVERLGEQERLRTLGDLDAAALLLARAAQAPLDPTVDDSRVRSATFDQASRSELETAIARVHAIVAHPGDRVAAGMRARYPHIRRFLPALLRQVTFDATTPADPALAAIQHLAAVEDGKAVLSDAPTSHVGRHWTALVFREDDSRFYSVRTIQDSAAGRRTATGEHRAAARSYMNHAIDHLGRSGTPTAESDQQRLLTPTTRAGQPARPLLVLVPTSSAPGNFAPS